MEFQDFHKDFFKAAEGAYSRVTDRENYDSQITLTDQEAELVINYFGKDNIRIGNVKGDKDLAAKSFYLYPNFEEIKLNVVFPKSEKTELRLYISSRGGFKPKGGEIWFLYIDSQNRLVVGAMEESHWSSLGQTDHLDDIYLDEVEEFLTKPTTKLVDVEGKIIKREVASRTIYVRNPQIAVNRFILSNYRCEVNPDHNTFISQRSNMPYVEAHHFLPMKFQHLFSEPLDTVDNVISLCPNCHRAIHHAVTDHKYELIQNIYSKRSHLHQHFTLDYIAQFYNSLRIIAE